YSTALCFSSFRPPRSRRSFPTRRSSDLQEVVDRHRDASRMYADALANKPRFTPASNADYHKRFVDVPLEIHQKVYKDALELAEARLQRRSGRSCSIIPCTFL